jgi:hypothetical protein
MRAAWRSCDPARHRTIVFEVRTEIAAKPPAGVPVPG